MAPREYFIQRAFSTTEVIHIDSPEESTNLEDKQMCCVNFDIFHKVYFCSAYI